MDPVVAIGGRVQRDPLIDQLRAVIPARRVLTDEDECRLYDSDGLTLHRGETPGVLLLENEAEVVHSVRVLAAAGIPFVARGAGTGLSGGAVPMDGAWVLDVHRMRQIIEVDPLQRTAVIEPGVINLDLDKAAAAHGLRFAPDPSSQRACTVGGNIAENSGGPHCFLHGMTTRHILAIRTVLTDGTVVDLERDGGGIDWRGAFIGSEGTFAITTRATVRLVPRPPSVRTFLVSYSSLEASCEAVAAIIAAGLRPAALEILDKMTIGAVEASVFRAGYPEDAEAVLLIELEGLPDEVEEAAVAVREAAHLDETIGFEEALDEPSRERLWRGRKGAFGAMGRIATDLYVLDAVVPRTRMAQAISSIQQIGRKHNVVLSNVFHAGDGNLHPNISFDSNDAQQRQQVLAAGDEILKLCVSLGGTLSGEHGIGMEKRDHMPLIFSPEQLETQMLLREAVDPTGLANPGKILPTGRGCTEAGFRGAAHLERTEQILGPDDA